MFQSSCSSSSSTGRRGEREKKEKETEAAEEGDKEVEKDVMGWTVVIRSRKRTVQTFVKVDGMKTVLMDVSPDERVQKILNTVSGSDQDMYVTVHGRVLRRSGKLNSCGVSDGCTIQITSRLCGRGGHKDKRNKAEKKRDKDGNRQKDQQVELVSDTCQEMTQSQKDVTIQMLEGHEGYWEMIKMISETGNEEHGMQCLKVLLQKELRFNEETMKVMDWEVRWAVEGRRKGRSEEQEQGGSKNKCVSAKKNSWKRRERKTQTSLR